MKYNNINSNLNPLDDELNKKHAQYEEFVITYQTNQFLIKSHKVMLH